MAKNSGKGGGKGGVALPGILTEDEEKALNDALAHIPYDGQRCRVLKMLPTRGQILETCVRRGWILPWKEPFAFIQEKDIDYSKLRNEACLACPASLRCTAGRVRLLIGCSLCGAWWVSDDNIPTARTLNQRAFVHNEPATLDAAGPGGLDGFKSGAISPETGEEYTSQFEAIDAQFGVSRVRPGVKDGIHGTGSSEGCCPIIMKLVLNWSDSPVGLVQARICKNCW